MTQDKIPEKPDAYNAKQKAKAHADIARFRELVEGAEVEFVGRDAGYRPDSPRLQAQIEERLDDGGGE